MSKEHPDIDLIYATIGRFAVEFEQICHTMESGIRCILALEGLQNERIQEIMLSGLNAEPLSALFRSLCSEYLKPNVIEAKIIKQVFSTLQHLISTRNDLLHSKWFLALSEEGVGCQAVAFGNKLHKNSKGAATKNFEYNLTNFKTLYEQSQACSWNVSKLVNCISGGYPLEKNFEITDKGEYEAIKGLCKKSITMELANNGG